MLARLQTKLLLVLYGDKWQKWKNAFYWVGNRSGRWVKVEFYVFAIFSIIVQMQKLLNPTQPEI